MLFSFLRSHLQKKIIVFFACCKEVIYRSPALSMTTFEAACCGALNISRPLCLWEFSLLKLFWWPLSLNHKLLSDVVKSDIWIKQNCITPCLSSVVFVHLPRCSTCFVCSVGCGQASLCWPCMESRSKWRGWRSIMTSSRRKLLCYLPQILLQEDLVATAFSSKLHFVAAFKKKKILQLKKQKWFVWAWNALMTNISNN